MQKKRVNRVRVGKSWKFVNVISKEKINYSEDFMYLWTLTSASK